MTGAGHNLFRRCVHRAASSSFSFPLSSKSLHVKPKVLLVSFSGKTTTPWPVMQSPSNDPLYPYAYTSGRWLHRDKEQRTSRYIDFNFDRLCNKVLALCPEATHIISYEKEEGGYNKVFIFLLDNGKRIVARLPTRVAGPSSLTTNSEVATITYIKARTTIPVPDILDWSDDSTNPIGSEYIIMQHAQGVPLRERWPTMSGSQYTKCVQSICMTMKQLATLEFPAYGSLYFANAPIDSASKMDFVEGFCIGPHCGTTYWDCKDGQTLSAPHTGPWSDLSAYASGLIDNGYSRLPVPGTESSRPSYFGTVEEHQNLLRSAKEVMRCLALEPHIRNAAAPTLLHADLHARNIYVSNDDPTKVTCLIDWQSSSIEPAFIYAHEVPDFATPPHSSYSEESEEETPSQVPSMTEQEKKLEKVARFCSQAYDICTKAFIPKLRVARSVDQPLVRPFQYCNTSWRDSAPAVRQEFLDLANQWEKLGLTGRCPYNPTAEELRLHQKEYKSFQHVQDLKLMLMDLLHTDSDGWVPTERWEEVRHAHKEVFDMAIETARDGEDETEDDHLSEEDVRELWPFDGHKCN